MRDLISASDLVTHPLTIERTGYVSTAALMADLWGYRSEDMSSPWAYSESEVSSETSSQPCDEDGEDAIPGFTNRNFENPRLHLSQCSDDDEEYASSEHTDGSDEGYDAWIEERAALEKQLDVLETPSFESLPRKAKEARDFWLKKPGSVALSN